MNEELAFVRSVIESQGLLACMFAYLIIQQKTMLHKLLAKNCEMNHFMMKCLERELDEDHISSGMHVPSSQSQGSNNTSPKE